LSLFSVVFAGFCVFLLFSSPSIINYQNHAIESNLMAVLSKNYRAYQY
jgi:hypothetical protein